MWDRIIETPVEIAVRRLAPRYFAELGYEGVRRERGGIQVTVITTHCEIGFSDYKWDVECWVKPRHDNCETRMVRAEPVHPRFVFRSGLVYQEVERGMQQVVERFRAALEGNFDGWPRE